MGPDDVGRFICGFVDWRRRHPLPDYHPRYVIYVGPSRRRRKKSMSRVIRELDKSMRRQKDIGKARRYVPWDAIKASAAPGKPGQ